MRVAVLSDIHENYHNLLKALDLIKEQGVERILCLGDLINAGIAEVLADSGLPVFCVWGNNDGDKVAIMGVALAPGSSFAISGHSYGFVEIDGRSVFLTHDPDLAGPMARSQEFDAVFYGHDHRKSQKQVGKCLVANPGEISAHKTGEATLAIYDTEQNRVEFARIPDAISVGTH
jgi:putative phosphoesterase